MSESFEFVVDKSILFNKDFKNWLSSLKSYNGKRVRLIIEEVKEAAPETEGVNQNV